MSVEPKKASSENSLALNRLNSTLRTPHSALERGTRFDATRAAMSEKHREKKDGQNKGKINERSDETHKNDHSALDAQTGHKNEGPLDHLDRDDFDRDLRPNEGKGENSGANSEHNPDRLMRAYDDKALVDAMKDFGSDELKQILIVPVGAKLEQGAHYIDLNDPDRLEILASGENPVTPHLEAQANQKLVPKSQIDYELWDKLTGKGERVDAT